MKKYFKTYNYLLILFVSLILLDMIGLIGFFSSWLTVLIVGCLYLNRRPEKIKRTEKGDKLAEHLLGFRKFLLTCDEDKLKTLLKEDPLYYDKLLSYAVVFGIETDLMKKLIPILDKDIKPGDGTYGSWESIGRFK